MFSSTHWQISKVSGWFSHPECRKESQELKQLVNRPALSLGAGVCVCLVTQSCTVLQDPLGCSPPGSSVHGIFQARILERVAISSSRGSSRPRDWTRISWTEGRFFTTELPGKPQEEAPWCLLKVNVWKGTAGPAWRKGNIKLSTVLISPQLQPHC